MSPIAISQNIIETPTKLKSIVESYLKCPQEDDVKIPVPSRVYQQSEVPNLLSERNLTFCYDIDREALHIKMPSILHESFNRYLGNTFLDACMCQNFFTWEQKSLVFYDRKSVHLPGTLSRKSMLKKEAWDKNPDGLFEIYSEVDNRYYSKIAVEIGFTENIDELRFDMEQWLLKCSSMSAVILVNINEDNRPTMKTLSTLARDRIRALIDDYGNSNCREIYDEGPDVSDEKSDDLGSTSSTVSASGMYDNIQARARAHPSDWVGNLSTTIEIWERRNQRLLLRNKLNDEPKLFLSDFFDAKENKSISIDMAVFREQLDRAKTEMAEDRAISFLRRRNS